MRQPNLRRFGGMLAVAGCVLDEAAGVPQLVTQIRTWLHAVKIVKTQWPVDQRDVGCRDLLLPLWSFGNRSWFGLPHLVADLRVCDH